VKLGRSAGSGRRVGLEVEMLGPRAWRYETGRCPGRTWSTYRGSGYATAGKAIRSRVHVGDPAQHHRGAGAGLPWNPGWIKTPWKDLPR